MNFVPRLSRFKNMLASILVTRLQTAVQDFCQQQWAEVLRQASTAQSIFQRSKVEGRQLLFLLVSH